MSGLIILVTMFCLALFSLECFNYLSASPSFPHQEIRDQPNDWLYVPLTSNSNCSIARQYLTQHSIIPDMEAVSYSSDGDYLNATIWLSGPFEQKPSPILRSPIYSMWISIVQSSNTSATTNYLVSINWNALNQSWTKSIAELSENDSRIISQELNSKNFFDNGSGSIGSSNKGHIKFSVNLNSVTSPQQYLLAFVMTDSFIIKGNLCGIVDVGEQAGYVPPPEFTMSVSPSPVQIRQGEEKTVELKMNSSTLTSPYVTLLPINDSGGTKVLFEPNETRISPGATATSLIKITALANAEIRPHTVEVNSLMKFPENIDPGSFAVSYWKNVTSETIKDEIASKISKRISTVNIPRPTYFEILVEHYTLEDRFKDFWDTYGDLTSLILGGFAAGGAALVLDKLTHRNKKNRDQTTLDVS